MNNNILSATAEETKASGSLKSKRKKTKKPSKSLFSMSNASSVASQISDTVFVLRQIIFSAKNSPSPSQFARQYILRPTFKNDLFVISFGLPALSATPRVLDAAPSVRSNASNWTYHGERTAIVRKGMLNVASYNYLGFVDLEYNTRKLLERSIKELPFANEQGCNDKLEEAMKTELRDFMDFEGCVLTPSGYAINLVAFPAMAASAKMKQEEHSNGNTIFLMDSESHSSMFMGAFIATATCQGKVMRFRHNDVEDLTLKLEMIYGPESTGSSRPNLWVAIEGMYSMDGTLPPLREIVMLKRKYGFRIYIDEAHSFLAIGSKGRGVVEYFEDNESSNTNNVTMQDIDMIGGTISKSMSSVGGFVLSSGTLKKYIEVRASDMRTSRGSSIPTLSLIRSLQILRKPKLVVERLAHLRSISTYVVDVLEAKGYRVSATKGSPLVAIIVDNVDRVLTFLKIGRQMGLICCGAAYPAAPRGAPRVRLSLTGAHGLDDVNEMLQLIDQISLTIGVRDLRIGRGVSHVQLSSKMQAITSNSSGLVKEKDLANHSDEIDASILAICAPAVNTQGTETSGIRAAGLSALSKYNLGAAGPRWMYGCFAAHMALEELLNKSVIQNSILPSHLAEQIQTTLFTDTRVGIMSVIATAMEGLTRQRTKRGEKHLILLPKLSGLEIKEGAAASQPDRSKHTRWYETFGANETSDGEDLLSILADEFNQLEKIHLTIYIDTGLLSKDNETANGEASLSAAIQRLSPLSTLKDRHPLSMTLILNDPHIFTSKFTSTRTFISALKSIFPTLFSIDSSIRFLLFGSFETLPHLPGFQGAFCTGSKHSVEKVQFLGQGVMYTAMMPPLHAALAEESLKVMLAS